MELTTTSPHPGVEDVVTTSSLICQVRHRPRYRQSNRTICSNSPTPPLQLSLNPLLALRYFSNLLERNVAPAHAKPATLAHDHWHDETKLDQPFPLASRNVFTPDFRRTSTSTHSACGGLDSRFRCECDVLVVCHVEVAGVGVVDDVEAGCGDEEGEGQRAQCWEDREF